MMERETLLQELIFWLEEETGEFNYHVHCRHELDIETLQSKYNLDRAKQDIKYIRDLRVCINCLENAYE